MPSAVTSQPGMTISNLHPPSTSPDTVDGLALGLELKFLLLGLPSCYSHGTDAGQDGHREAYAAIASVIGDKTGRGVDPLARRRGSAHVSAISRHDIQDAGRQERQYWASHWIVKKANSVVHTDTDPLPSRDTTNGVPVPVELSSPTIPWSRQGRARLEPVSTVLQRLSALPLAVNHSCDVHVHIGRRDGAPFALPTLKRLATVLWLAEPVLRCVRDRRSPNVGHTYTWGFAQRRYSRLATRLAASSSALAVDAIAATSSARELGQLLSGSGREHRRLGFNFSAFGGEDERARTNPRTVEVRFMDGTLRGELVLGWLEICGKLVEVCIKGSQGRYDAVVEHLVGQQEPYRQYEEEEEKAAQAMRDETTDMNNETKRTDTSRHPLVHPDLPFGELMDVIGVDVAVYAPFQDKMRREYGMFAG